MQPLIKYFHKKHACKDENGETQLDISFTITFSIYEPTAKIGSPCRRVWQDTESKIGSWCETPTGRLIKKDAQI